MKKYLIMGGAGFIGSNLAYRYAQDKENEIYIIDNLSTGKMENLKEIVEKYKNVHFYKEDIRNSNIIKFIKDNKFDNIYNFACPASPKYYLKFPIDTWETSIIGISNILKAIKGTKTKLLQASTSEVYGDAKEIPQREEYWGHVNCNGVRACYDEGKRAAESLIFDYKRLYNVDVRVIRIFNTYGPRMDKNDGRIISNFINQAINNIDITIYGTGKQTRSFCYVDDTINAIIKIMDRKEHVDYPINIGNPIEISVKKVADIIKMLTKSKSDIVFCNAMNDEPQRRKPDITNAINLLGWKPKIELQEGLIKCIKYYNKK